MVETFSVSFREGVEKDLKELDKQVAQRILNKIKWLSRHFHLVTPEPLHGPWKGKYKLRVGDYRIVYSVQKQKRLIVVHLIGHRKAIYQRHK